MPNMIACLCQFTAENSTKKVTHQVHILDSLTLELQALNVEQKQTVDDITDRFVDL